MKINHLYNSIFQVKENIAYYQPVWVLVIILIGIMILGYTYSSFNHRFNIFLKAAFMTRFSQQLSKDERTLSHPASIFLSINFLIFLSLFILQTLKCTIFFKSEIEFSFFSFLLIVAVLFCIYAGKLFLLKIFSFVIDYPKAIREYILSLFLINQMLGIILIPIIIFTSYGNQQLQEYFILLGLTGLLLSFLMRIVQGVIIAFYENQTPAFYIILYLCIFEILPLLIGIRLIQEYV